MLWGGRFSKEIDNNFLKFSSSIEFDINLIKYDILVSKAHAKMLGNCGIIAKNESDEIVKGLELVEAHYTEGKWDPLKGGHEDIHSAVESYLTGLIGDTAQKLHSGRSRNDQVATGFRMWIKDSAQDLISSLSKLQKAFVELAEDNVNTIIPGYTHLQRAQPISFAFHMLAYVEMFERDKDRLQNVFKEADVCPLGAGALAGTTLPIDRNFTARELGFSKVSANALDSVSDRDFVIDYLNACSVGMMHISRLCEELILWSSSEWSLIEMDDSVTTGSSLMPQKKNPDAAELVRGKIGRTIGNQFSLITMMKSLPLSYNRDMQEDKEPVFDSYNTYGNSISVIESVIVSLSVNKNRFIDELKGDYMLATDLADWLVSNQIPFRKAHSIVGQVVKYAIDNSKKLDKLSLDELKKFDNVFNESVFEYLDIKTSLDRKKSFGSPNPQMVTEQIAAWKHKLG